MTAVRIWRCKLCGRRVMPHYDHVGPRCEETSTEEDCSGTFTHPIRSTCAKRGIDLTHEMVEVRGPISAEEAEET